jgi:hypothetical protein
MLSNWRERFEQGAIENRCLDLDTVLEWMTQIAISHA